jgi:hypothetical protein
VKSLPGVRETGRRAEGPPVVLHVDPDDGRRGVFRDAPVVVRVSQPLDEGRLEPASLSVCDPSGPVPGRVRLVGDGDVLVWTASRSLRPDAPHFIVVDGLFDRRGRPVPRHLSRFVPCPFASGDWQDEARGPR